MKSRTYNGGMMRLSLSADWLDEVEFDIW
jgi:hypothetical protein